MKEALRVLIADDEALARRVLLHLLDRLDPPVEVIWVAENGAEAIERALVLKPDVVLLDIRMPGIGGLEAARSIRENLPSCAVILVTAYREFDLAKDAIQLGVGCYLVKPVDPGALQEALAAVVRAKETEIAETRRREELLRQIELARPLVETALVTDLAHGNLNSVSTVEQIAGYLGKQLPSLAMLVDVDEFKRNTMDVEEIDRQVLIHQVSLGIKRAMTTSGLAERDYLMAPSGRDALIVLVAGTGKTDDAAREWALGLGWSICRETERSLGEHVTVGIGYPKATPLLLWASYREACTAERFKALLGKGRPIHIHDLAYTDAPDRKTLLSLERQMAAAVRIGDVEEGRSIANALVKELFRVAGDRAGSSGSTASYLAEVIAVICRQMLNEDEDPGELWNLKHLHSGAILAADTPDRLILALEDAVAALTAFSESARWARNKPGVGEALRFIQANYARDISLADVAGAVHLSQFYLTRLIKECTGLSFIRYLTKVRIEQARELLAQTNFTLSEIAKAVGYMNDTYFNKVFRRETGMPPGHFRCSGPARPAVPEHNGGGVK